MKLSDFHHLAAEIKYNNLSWPVLERNNFTEAQITQLVAQNYQRLSTEGDFAATLAAIFLLALSDDRKVLIDCLLSHSLQSDDFYMSFCSQYWPDLFKWATQNERSDLIQTILKNESFVRQLISEKQIEAKLTQYLASEDALSIRYSILPLFDNAEIRDHFRKKIYIEKQIIERIIRKENHTSLLNLPYDKFYTLSHQNLGPATTITLYRNDSYCDQIDIKICNLEQYLYMLDPKMMTCSSGALDEPSACIYTQTDLMSSLAQKKVIQEADTLLELSVSLNKDYYAADTESFDKYIIAWFEGNPLNVPLKLDRSLALSIIGWWADYDSNLEPKKPFACFEIDNPKADNISQERLLELSLLTGSKKCLYHFFYKREKANEVIFSLVSNYNCQSTQDDSLKILLCWLLEYRELDNVALILDKIVNLEKSVTFGDYRNVNILDLAKACDKRWWFTKFLYSLRVNRSPKNVAIAPMLAQYLSRQQSVARGSSILNTKPLAQETTSLLQDKKLNHRH